MKNKIIVKQTIELYKIEKKLKEAKELFNELNGRFINIGEPLNDNLLKFNKEQIKWCMEVHEKIIDIKELIIK